MKDILLCGVGGQGSILASRLIAHTAMMSGMHVRSADTIGMAQRGGSVVSFIRYSDKEVYSPLLAHGQADLIIGFEPGEVLRCIDYLKRDGTVIMNAEPVIPVTASLGKLNYNPEAVKEYLKRHIKNLHTVNTQGICKACGSYKVLNTALLGAACETKELGLTRSAVKDAIRKTLPEKFVDMNIKALTLAAAFLNSSFDEKKNKDTE